MADVKRIENHTARVLILPGTESHPEGKPLIPGLNTIPNLYWDELQAYEVDKFDRSGKKKGTRFPARETLEQLQVPVSIVTGKGVSFGPQITIYEDAMVDRPDGIIPESLDTYNEVAALKMIEIVNDRTALRRYTKSRLPSVAAAAKAKLGGQA